MTKVIIKIWTLLIKISFIFKGLPNVKILCNYKMWLLNYWTDWSGKIACASVQVALGRVTLHFHLFQPQGEMHSQATTQDYLGPYISSP